MTYMHARARATADRIISKWGFNAILRRQSGDRACVAALVDFSPAERRGELVQATDRRFIIKATGLTAPPSSEAGDRFVKIDPDTLAEEQPLRIVQPPGKLEHQGRVVYWTIHCRP